MSFKKIILNIHIYFKEVMNMSNVDNEFVETFHNLFDADQRDNFRAKHVTVSNANEIAKAIDNK
jgi:hypothetical protein